MLAPSRGRYVFDIETNGFLEEVTVIHCAVMIDLDTEEVHAFGPDQIDQFLKLYQSATTLIGHYIIGFDMPVIDKLHGVVPAPDCEIIDTVNLGRLVFPDIKAIDMPMAKKWKAWKIKYDFWVRDQLKANPELPEDHDFGRAPHLPDPPKEFPGYLVGSHSLEAYGYRMGTERKGDYSKEMKAKGLDPWAEWNPAMHDYMIQDGRVNLLLFRWLMEHAPTAQSVLLEMRVQRLISQVERNGWPFNRKAAEDLYQALCAERDALGTSLRSLFPAWEVQLEDFIPKRNNKTKGYIAGVPVPRSEIVEFNPASRDHIADRLTAKYGWKPVEYTESGKPKVDDDVLKKLPYPEAQQLARYFLIQKRIGQVGEGTQAWLKVVSKDGFIHGRYNTNGAVSGRATHSTPNVAQVPGVLAEFGKQCRALFTVLKGYKQLGADQAGLELRCLGSFMATFDKGAYIQTVLFGDVHWENAKALFGLPDDTERFDGKDENGDEIKVPAHEKFRAIAKTFIYAFLYGSGDENLGSIAGVTDDEAAEWSACPKHRAAYLKMRSQLEARARKFGDQPPTKQQLRHAYKGLLLRGRFMAKFPALAKLLKAVKDGAKKGWLKGLDGRKLPVRSAHAALNVLLQSAGAIICKQWIADAEDALVAAGLTHGWGGDFVILGWIHDELQIAVKDGLEDQVAEIVVAAARKAGDPFPTWKCPTDGDVIVGANWAECH
jgi:hypothetical protein